VPINVVLYVSVRRLPVSTFTLLPTYTQSASGPVPWTDVYFHVDFFDFGGKRTDVGTDENYEYYLPANATASFKVSFAREFPEINYFKAVVRVVSAKDARSRW
jgi:hypothetical protein